MEAVTLVSENEGGPRDRARERMGLAFVRALTNILDHAATESLVRHAVVSSSENVRDGATIALGERPLHDFVPILLEGLAMPVQSTFRVVTGNDGSVHYLHTLHREGSQNDWKHETSRVAFRRATNRELAARLANDVSQGTLAANARSAGRGAATAAQFAAQFVQEAMLAEQQVALLNQSAAALNDRIIPVLKSVSGKDFGDQARDWWDWWRDDNDYYQESRPVYETNDATYAQYSPPSVPVSAECFIAGTPVWTKTGQQPIDSLVIGDLVLAQDVDTGEMAYKPVIGRTVRPPRPLLRLRIGRETLITTQGHPLWVVGVGWRMAKQLNDGAVLHSVTGAARVNAIEPTNAQETFNLIVADFNTYFVGERGILVHDNTPRRPTRSGVPGIASNSR
jgi:hypothetical protein